jgi:hypothetical protein
VFFVQFGESCAKRSCPEAILAFSESR